MNTILKRSALAWMIPALVLVAVSPAFAGGGDKTLALGNTPSHEAAFGTAHISGDRIQILAGGLKPESVYTVWFVNTEPKKHETGAGLPPYMFRTDADGDAVYVSELDNSPVGQWEMVMIVQHPNGDPKDMKNMVGALKAKI